MRRYAEQFDATISSSPIVLSSHIDKHFGPSGTTLFLKGTLRFIDASVLEIALFANESGRSAVVEKYRFHYMDKDGQMLFRYDNAPHHPAIDSFPHHKHEPDNALPSDMPTIQDLLNEISAIILRKQP